MKRHITYTIIGPSLGTFSPPMTLTSVKNEWTARLATKRMTPCNAVVFGGAAVLIGVVKTQEIGD
jgi:hypothetical protein